MCCLVLSQYFRFLDDEQRHNGPLPTLIPKVRGSRLKDDVLGIFVSFCSMIEERIEGNIPGKGSVDPPLLPSLGVKM